MNNYNILVKRHELPLGVGGHLYFEVQNAATGNAITQIHGLATSRATDPITGLRQTHSMGNSDDQIVVYDNLITNWNDGPGTQILSLNQAEWDRASNYIRAAANEINTQNYDYDLLGQGLFGYSGVNSNSIFRTMLGVLNTALSEPGNPAFSAQQIDDLSNYGSTTATNWFFGKNPGSDNDILQGDTSWIPATVTTFDPLTFEYYGLINSDSVPYLVYRGSINSSLSDMGVTELSGDAIVIETGDGSVSIIHDTATALIDGIEYVVIEIADSLTSAQTAVGTFVSDLTAAGTDWFAAEGGAGLSFQVWLAAHSQALFSGNISADDALISLAQQLGQDFIADFVTSNVVSKTDADSVITQVLTEEFGIEAAAAIRYADAVYVSLGRFALDFALSGFNAEQAAKAGLITLAGALATEFLKDAGFSHLSAAAGVQAIAQAVQLITNFDDYNSFDDLAKLGVNAGLAAAAGAAGVKIASLLLGNPVTLSNPVSIIATAVVAFVGGKIFGKALFGSVKYGAGEYATKQALLNSTYQVQTITLSDGTQVPALVAVNKDGATILATNISHIIGGTGADVLVGDHAVQTVLGNGGADYLEGRGGDDNLLGGAGNDLINGGVGNDVIQGDAGDDQLFGEADDDIVIAGDGDDFVHLGSGDDVAAGGSGHDQILAGGEGNCVRDAHKTIFVVKSAVAEYIESMLRRAANDNWVIMRRVG